MPVVETCPHCDGAKKNYIIVPKGDGHILIEKDCYLCGGTGVITKGDPPGPADVPQSTQSPELWPLLIPLGIFVLFFFFLWL